LDFSRVAGRITFLNLKPADQGRLHFLHDSGIKTSGGLSKKFWEFHGLDALDIEWG
jgi:hypothetical protein